MSEIIAGIPMPDSAIARAATQLVELSAEIRPRGQPRGRGEPPVLDTHSHCRSDLGSQRGLPGTIEFAGESSHRVMVQPESSIL